MSRADEAVSRNISEFLQGIRQVRFSSLEKLWEARILESRARELRRIWRAVTMSQLEFDSNVGPILFASVSLVTCALETGQLIPSRAFASFGLFSNIHKVVRDLVVLKAKLFQSWVSCHRIQRYLKELEREDFVSPNSSATEKSLNQVSVENVALSWLAGSTSASAASSHFKLQNMSLCFPQGELSVIIDKTGSGKSLLLASILGETILEAGRITRPSAPLTPDSFNKYQQTPEQSWIIPGTLALVVQPPWIENCTIKDNILFGSRFDASRYATVLRACALGDLDRPPG